MGYVLQVSHSAFGTVHSSAGAPSSSLNGEGALTVCCWLCPARECRWRLSASLGIRLQQLSPVASYRNLSLIRFKLQGKQRVLQGSSAVPLVFRQAAS